MGAFKQTPYILVEMEAEDGEKEKGGDHSDKSELQKEALSTEVGTQSTHFVIFYALLFGFHRTCVRVCITAVSIASVKINLFGGSSCFVIKTHRVDISQETCAGLKVFINVYICPSSSVELVPSMKKVLSIMTRT